MSIIADDLHFYAAERMTDLESSGGYSSSDEVLDNIDNNVFPDIASGDRIGGRTHLRKIHAAVRSGDTDVYMASRVFIASVPDDPNVTVGLLVTGNSADTRQDALEALYTEAQQDINTNLRLYQNYNAGETTISVYHFTGQSTPFIGYNISNYSRLAVGRLLMLEDEAGDAVQYVKITSISFSSILIGGYQTATITFAPPLRATFRGEFKGISGADAEYQTPTQIYTTRSVPMGHGIYGITPLSLPADEGDIEVSVDTVEIPVAPTLYEILDASVKPSSVPVQASKVVAAVNGRIQATTLDPMPDLETISVRLPDGKTFSGLYFGDLFTVSGTSISILLPTANAISIEQLGTHQSVYLDNTNIIGFTLNNVDDGVVPGTVMLRMAYGSTSQTFMDNGSGAFSGGLTHAAITFTGTINYSTGVISLTFSANFATQISVHNYRYLSTWQKILWTYGDTLTGSTVFNILLSPDLVPGSLQVTANTVDDGELLTVDDDAAGALTGDATGTITYSTGLMTITYAENVDVNSVLAAYQYRSPSTINQVAAGTLDTVRLPASKSFPLVRIGDQVIIHHPMSETLPNPAVAETTYTLDRANVDQIWLESCLLYTSPSPRD